jgi:branched-chain amino acid transport system permease protein
MTSLNLGLQYALDAISIGCIYAIIALSLALLFGIMDLVNFAFGELIMVGGYTLYFTYTINHWGLPQALTATVIAVTVTSLLMDLVAFRPLRHARAETLLITSFGLSYGLQSLARIVAGAKAKGLALPSNLTDVIYVGQFRLATVNLVTSAVTVALLIVLAFVLKRTMLGIHLRAAAEDFTMARLVGISASRTISAAFAITGLLAGIVSLFIMARIGSVSSTMGQEPLLIAFIAAVLGGLGSLEGAAAGGFVLGCLTGLLQAVLPTRVASLQEAVLFGIVILILIIRPQGLLGRPTQHLALSRG